MPAKSPDYKVKTQTLAAALTNKPMLVNARMILFNKIPSDCTVRIGSVNADVMSLEKGTQKKLILCGPKDDRIEYIYISCAVASGLLEVYTSEELDVDFSAASANGSSVELVLATIVPRDIPSATLATTDPFLDLVNPLSEVISGDGSTAMIYDAGNGIIGARYTIAAGAVAFSHAGGHMNAINLPLANIINTPGIVNHRGRNWYVELADSIYTSEVGTNIIRRGFGFGVINETVAGWNRPFIGFQADRGHTDWRLRAKALTSGQVLSVPLTGYSPLEIQALKLRIGQDDTIPYVEAWINGFLVHRETMPLSANLTEMGSFPMTPWEGVARSLAADTVTMWGLLDGAMTLKLVYPDG